MIKITFFSKHVVLLFACLLVFSACGQPYVFRGKEIAPAKPAPDFTLTDQNGQPFTLSAQRGNVVVLFFGFTSCPDVCPTTLADIASAREKLGGDANNVKVAMVTVDPERDSAEKMAGYMRKFDPSFIGLTGAQAQISPVLGSYGVMATKKELPNSKLGYTMDHSAYVYLIDKAGNWRALLDYGATVDDIASDVRYLVHNS